MYGSSNIYDKEVIIDWKYYDVVYGEVAHQITINIFLNPIKGGGGG